jgi:hypothetical protein
VAGYVVGYAAVKGIEDRETAVKRLLADVRHTKGWEEFASRYKAKAIRLGRQVTWEAGDEG